ncbi:MAG TPA: GDSL-type esterase/lipase family protein [Flavisolibacter sp.]
MRYLINMSISNCLLICFFCLFVGCASSKNSSTGSDTLTATKLQPYGRTAITNDQLELISSASHFAVSFDGSDCQVFASLAAWQDHNYLQYEMDGGYQKRIRISKGDQQPITISAGSDGNHTIKIFKATEAHTGPVFIQKITAKNVRAIKPSSLPVVEFIGNSITCGAAADPSEVPCGKGEYHDQHNAYMAYGPRVARTLNTNFILSSVSGIGIYRNWNSDGPTMPQVYEKTDFQHTSNRLWEFKTYAPNVVSIALGTNDFSNGDGKKQRDPFDSAGFVGNYIRFVQQVKAKYPAAQIALLSSPMMNGERRTLLQNCLAAVKNNIDRLYPSGKLVAVHFFKPMQARGCSGHPSVEDHGIMAEELVPFFQKLLQ